MLLVVSQPFGSCAKIIDARYVQRIFLVADRENTANRQEAELKKKYEFFIVSSISTRLYTSLRLTVNVIREIPTLFFKERIALENLLLALSLSPSGTWMLLKW